VVLAMDGDAGEADEAGDAGCQGQRASQRHVGGRARGGVQVRVMAVELQRHEEPTCHW